MATGIVWDCINFQVESGVIRGGAMEDRPLPIWKLRL